MSFLVSPNKNQTSNSKYIDMVDIVIEGEKSRSVWGMVHVDFFHDAMPDNPEVCRELHKRQEVVLELVLACELGELKRKAAQFDEEHGE